MRIAVALASFAIALAGCGQGGGNSQNMAGGLPTPGARPGSTGSASADQDFRQRYRDLNISSCVLSAQRRSARGNGAPAGTDFRGFCTCAVDGTMAGLGTDQLVRMRPGPREQAIAEQCAREMGLRTNFKGSGGQ